MHFRARRRAALHGGALIAALERALIRATLVALFVLLAIFARCAMAAAEGAPANTHARALALEHTWTPGRPLPLRAWQGISHVLRKRSAASHVSLDAMASLYCSGLREPASVAPASRWKLHLRADCEQPDEWPATLAWSAWRPGCVALHEFVAAFDRGEVADPYPRARHWGGAKLPRDHARCVAMGVVGASGGTEFCGAVKAQEASGR